MKKRTKSKLSKSGARRRTCLVTNHVRSFSIVLLFILGSSGFLHSQMNYWVMPPYSFNVAQSPVATSPMFGTGNGAYAYNVSNGAYDQNGGGLLFYIEDFSVKSPNGTTLGQLGTGGAGLLGGEIVILPVSGACRKFYVIYSFNNYVKYTIVDCSASTTTIDKGNGPGNNGSGYLIAGFSYLGTGLAASKKTTDPNYSGFVYYLYMVNSGEVWGSVISATGSSVPTLIYDSYAITPHYYNDVYNGGWQYFAQPCTEVELFENPNTNNRYLAFNGIDQRPGYRWSSGKAEVLKLTTPIPSSPLTSNYAMYNDQSSVIYGLEFAGTNSSGEPYLYVAGERIYNPPTISSKFEQFDITTQGTPVDIYQLSPTTYEVTKSFIELSKSGQMCFVCTDASNNRFFVEYDLSNGVFNPTPIDVTGLDVTPGGVTGGLLPAWDNVFVLPDQIDGENYTLFTTTPFTNVAYVTINQNMPASDNVNDCVFNEAYNCLPINLNAYFNYENPVFCENPGGSISIHQVDGDDCTPLVGTGYFNCDNCSGGFLSNDNPWEVDIRKFSASDGQNVLSLQSHTGYFLVTWTFIDCCGNISSKTSHVRILGAVPPQINLQIYDYNNPQTYLGWTQSTATPNDVGASSLGFRVSGSTGNVTSMTVKVDEYNAAGGYVNTLTNETKPVANLAGLTYENLNGYCVSSAIWGSTPPTATCNVSSPSSYTGYKSYYSYNNTSLVGKYYRLTVTLANPCSSSFPEWTYLRINSAYNRPESIVSVEEINGSEIVKVFPNPATNELFISNSGAKSDGSFDIELLDLLGKSILHYSGKSETQAQSINISQVPAGVYFWKYQSEGKSSLGKIQVMR